MQVLTSAKARSFAETNWGRGGTTSYRTNRRGVYYFSCSGHGGYVVDGYALTEDERAEIDKYVTSHSCTMVFNPSTQRIIFLQNPCTIRTQRYRYNPEVHTIVKDYPIYFFEEDCDWAVLEKFTDIRAKHTMTPAEREKAINDTFTRWFPVLC